MRQKPRIGRSDRIDLPELQLFDLEAKIDTGAFTSSLHCTDIAVIRSQGKRVLHFCLLDPEHPAYNGATYLFEQFERRKVKSSNGETERRYIIRTSIRLYGKDYRSEFTLTDRGNMKFPVLLGRQLLQKGFLVDVTKKDLSFHHKYALGS